VSNAKIEEARRKTNGVFTGHMNMTIWLYIREIIMKTAAVCDLEAVETGYVRFAELRKRGVAKTSPRKRQAAPMVRGGWQTAALTIGCLMLTLIARDSEIDGQP